MTSSLRLSRPSDINNFRDLDIKCYDYPLAMEQWEALTKSSGQNGEARCMLAHYGASIAAKPVGFAVWQYNETDIILLRLGVDRRLRRRGLGTSLVQSVFKDAREKLCERITITVPACHTLPGDPDNVVGFLNHCNFRASGLVYHDWKFMFGKMEDGFEFEAAV